MSDKVPEMVVWSEEEGYYARKLTYGSNLGAPSIKLEDSNTWKQVQVRDLNQFFSSKFSEILVSYKKLMEDVYWNEVVYGSKFSFVPKIGDTYHLYVNENQENFLSIIEPNSWKMKHLGSFYMNSDKKWVKID